MTRRGDALTFDAGSSAERGVSEARAGLRRRESRRGEGPADFGVSRPPSCEAAAAAAFAVGLRGRPMRILRVLHSR